MNELIEIDCMEYMSQCKDNAYDLVIVDPPYGIGAENYSNGQNLNRKDGWYREEATAVRIKKNRLNQGSGKLKNNILNTSNCEWDNKKPDQEYFNELLRVSKNQIIWGLNYFIDYLHSTRGVYVWDKLQYWENFSQFELAWTSFDKPARLFKYSNSGGINKEKKIHPTQKPIKLYKDLLLWYAKPGDKLLDTHSGSGSFRIAAHDLGFDLVSCELDPDYCRDNEARYQRHIQQIDLFKPEEIQEKIFTEGKLF